MVKLPLLFERSDNGFSVSGLFPCLTGIHANEAAFFVVNDLLDF